MDFKDFIKNYQVDEDKKFAKPRSRSRCKFLSIQLLHQNSFKNLAQRSVKSRKNGIEGLKLPSIDEFITEYKEPKMLYLYRLLENGQIGNEQLLQIELDQLSDEQREYQDVLQKEYLSDVEDDYGGSDKELLMKDKNDEKLQANKDRKLKDKAHKNSNAKASAKVSAKASAKAAPIAFGNYAKYKNGNQARKIKKMDILEIEEVEIESFDHFLMNVDTLKVFHVSDNEIKVLNTNDNRVLKIDKGKLIDSIFNMPHKDDPINTYFDNNNQNQMLSQGYLNDNGFEEEGDRYNVNYGK